MTDDNISRRETLKSMGGAVGSIGILPVGFLSSGGRGPVTTHASGTNRSDERFETLNIRRRQVGTNVGGVDITPGPVPDVVEERMIEFPPPETRRIEVIMFTTWVFLIKFIQMILSSQTPRNFHYSKRGFIIWTFLILTEIRYLPGQDQNVTEGTLTLLAMNGMMVVERYIIIPHPPLTTVMNSIPNSSLIHCLAKTSLKILKI